MLDFPVTKVKVQVWDTAGSDHSNALLKIYYKKAMGIILVFSLDDKKSFENLHMWMQYVQNISHPSAIVTLIGNKSDLSEQFVNAKEITEFQKQYRIDRYIEISVKEGSHINELFTELVKDIKDRLDSGQFRIEEKSPLRKNYT